MSLNPVKTALAMQNGVSMVCATCTRYWQARDKGLPDPTCLTDRFCASPLAGDSFHNYAGPLTEDRFAQWCFVCGSDSDYGLRIGGNDRTIGVCEEHMKYFGTLRATSLIPHFDKIQVVGAKGEMSLSDLFAKPKKKTVGEAIYEVEKYYADKEGREL